MELGGRCYKDQRSNLTTELSSAIHVLASTGTGRSNQAIERRRQHFEWPEAAAQGTGTLCSQSNESIDQRQESRRKTALSVDR